MNHNQTKITMFSDFFNDKLKDWACEVNFGSSSQNYIELYYQMNTDKESKIQIKILLKKCSIFNSQFTEISSIWDCVKIFSYSNKPKNRFLIANLSV